MLPSAIGIPIALKVDNMLSKLVWQCVSKGGCEAGGSIMRKSSKMWHAKLILQLLIKIHSKASESLLKIQGALLSPKGKTLS